MLQKQLFNLVGGATKGSPTPGKFNLMIVIMALLLLIIKTLIVYWGYNLLMPKLISTLTENPEKIMSNYRPLTFWEALVLIILVSSLIS